MATNQADPVQGLVDYILEIKPFHTKIIEVLVEYVHSDDVSVSIEDNIQFFITQETSDEKMVLAVTFGEDLRIAAGISLDDNTYVYNLENTDRATYDGVPATAHVASSPPTITVSPIPPALPTVDDFWFNSMDPASGNMYRWNGVFWTITQTVYWYDTIAEQLYYRTWYKFNGTTVDTGWVLTSSNTSFDITTPGYNVVANAVFHAPDCVSVDVGNNTFSLIGGDFSYRFFTGIQFDGYSTSNLINTWEIDNFTISSITVSTPDGFGGYIPNTGKIVIPGNFVATLIPGVRINITDTVTTKGWYTVVTAVVVGPNTEITVVEPITDSGILGSLGTVRGAVFDPATNTTILFPNTAVDNQVQMIAYQTSIPNTEMVTGATITDSIIFEWSNDNKDWFQYLIFASTTNTITLAEDATGHIQVGQDVEIFASINNNGVYTVLGAVYDNINNVTTVTLGGPALPLVAGGVNGFIEPSTL